DLPLVILGFEEVVHLRSPRLLMDFDSGAVRGNVLEVDSQGFTKSQSTGGAEHIQHAVLRLPSSGNQLGDFAACERWPSLLFLFDHAHVDELVIPLSRMN